MPTHFTPATFAFLTELAANNNREWFRANKRRALLTLGSPCRPAPPTRSFACRGSA